MSWLASTALSLLQTLGYPGLFFLMALESACPFLPSALVLPLVGFLVASGVYHFSFAVLIAALGCVLGGLGAHLLSRWGGRPLVLRWGPYVGLDLRTLDRAERFFARAGLWAVLVGRMMPGVRTLLSFPAGVARMPLLPYVLMTFVGSLPWCAALIGAGALLGERWTDLAPVLDAAGAVVLGALALALLVWWKRRTPARATR